MSQFNKENSIEVSNLSVTYDLDGKSIQAVKILLLMYLKKQ